MTLSASAARPHADDDASLARSVRLFRMFRTEQADPDHYYRVLSEDTTRQLARYAELDGRTVLDVGGGGGWFSAAFRARGARCLLLEPDPAELYSRGKPPPAAAVLADGLRLPVRDGAADIAFSSNVLEHVPDPLLMLDEMIRVTKPGGIIYLAYTNWYSPWGGHEMSPWHYLGAGYAERRYIRVRQCKPKHRVGESLFPVSVGRLLRAVRDREGIEVVDARPRYLPPWCRPLVRVPGLREVATWNLLLVLRRTR